MIPGAPSRRLGVSFWVSGGLWRVGRRAQGLILAGRESLEDAAWSAQPWKEGPLCSCYSRWQKASTPAHTSPFTSRSTEDPPCSSPPELRRERG